MKTGLNPDCAIHKLCGLGPIPDLSHPPFLTVKWDTNNWPSRVERVNKSKVHGDGRDPQMFGCFSSSSSIFERLFEGKGLLVSFCCF